MKDDSYRAPPKTFWEIAGELGPGFVLAVGVMGSGEVIGTTKTAAEAGWSLLLLILIGCVIKVPIQLQFGSFAFTSGKGTIDALNEIPGPRLHVRWAVWFWVLMQITTVMQLGGILHGASQALAMLLPITGDYVGLLAAQEGWDAQALGAKPAYMTWDDITWAIVIAGIVMFLLRGGGYAIVERFSKYMAITFTFLTFCCVGALQLTDYRITWSNIETAFSLNFLHSGQTGLATALATWGIIGMGATDLIGYVYWMIEKGYASNAGPSDAEGWLDRARGWARVMVWDARTAALAYTFATVCFYVIAACVLHPQNLNPSGMSMVKTLSQMYVPFFGAWTAPIFLLGIISVLFSCFTIGTATHSRVQAAAVRTFKLGAATEEKRVWWVKMFSIALPCMAVFFLVVFRQPVFLILIAGVFQSIMLPILGFAALYFRYRRNDQRILRSGWLSDTALWICEACLICAGIWTISTFVWKLSH